MVVETGEQVNAQSKAASSMPVGFLEHAADLQAADDVFDQHPLAGQDLVVGALLGRERRLFAPAFERRTAPGVELGQTLVAAVGEQFGGGWHPQAAALEQVKVVFAALAASRRQDRASGFVHGHLAL